MSMEDAMAQMRQSYERAGRDLAQTFNRLVEGLPRGDQSGWYYVEALGADTADGRKTATVKPKSAATGAGNPALGPLVCLHAYTPIVGQRVLVTWVAGDRADGVITG